MPSPARSSFDVSPAAALRAEEEARRRGEDVLLDAAALVAGSTRVETELVFGHPSEAILRRAAELGAHLVVLGSKGKTPLEALLFGSTGVAVARRARCAVVVVRHGSGSAPVGATSDGPAPWAAGRARDAARNAGGWWDLR